MLSHWKHTKCFLILDSAVKFNGSVLSDINSSGILHIYTRHSYRKRKSNKKQTKKNVQKSVPIVSYDVSDFKFLYGIFKQMHQIFLKWMFAINGDPILYLFYYVQSTGRL